MYKKVGQYKSYICIFWFSVKKFKEKSNFRKNVLFKNMFQSDVINVILNLNLNCFFDMIDKKMRVILCEYRELIFL